MIALNPWTLQAIAAVPEGKAPVQEAYGKLPLVFEANRGQTDPQVQFLSRGPGHTLFLTPTEAVLVLSKWEESSKGKFESRQKAIRTVLRMAFLGANAEPRVVGHDELPGKANYFIGNDPTKWRTHVPTYAKVQYRDLYPGVDLIYYGTHRHLEYDVVVRAGADPNRIVLGFQGADRLEVDAQGDLVLRTAAGAIRQRKPVIYQEVGGVRKEIPGGYVLTGEHQVGFKVAAYDTSQPLVIDPALFYSTYLGGTGGDTGAAIAVDAAGNAYVTGVTDSSDFPTTTGAFQTTFSGGINGDAYVTTLNPAGSAVVYSTYLGGSGDENGVGIAVDAAGNAYVTGFTNSSNFPTTTGAFQTTFSGLDDAFVTKLNPTGSVLVYSTYLGGSGGYDHGNGIAVDAAGNAYVTGQTVPYTIYSSNFPTTTWAFQTTLGGGYDAFVTKLNPTGSALVYSTYLGGNDNDQGFGIAVDAAGNAYVTGYTNSSDFPTTTGAFQTTLGGGNDAFVAKITDTQTLTVTKVGSGDGTVTSSPTGITCGTTCSASFASGTSVTLTATAFSGSTFTGWSGAGCSGTGTCVVTMSAAQAVSASFTQMYTLTVTSAGNGSGTVTSSPSGITCGATCSASFASGTSVTLTATAFSGSTFTGWSGAGCSGTGTCVVTMSATQSVAATFMVSGIDLIETAVTNPPSSIGHKGSFSVTDTTMNQGAVAAGASTTRYYLSVDTQKSSDDIRLNGSRSVPGLASGASSTGTITVTIPANVNSGTFFLLACADDLNVVSESNEGNNCRASASQVTVAP
jgi:hypothetical protein